MGAGTDGIYGRTACKNTHRTCPCLAPQPLCDLLRERRDSDEMTLHTLQKDHRHSGDPHACSETSSDT
jgi:hypothetical protein